MKITIRHNEKILSDNYLLANNPWTRLVGYMFKDEPKDYDGIFFIPGRSIHTFFMRFPIDVVFVSNKGKVIRIIRDLKPWRMTSIYFKAHNVLEVPAGKLPLDIKEGQVLEVIHV